MSRVLDLNVAVGTCTDVGCVREVNEDSVLASAPVFAVADGMGGHAAGDVASAIAVAELSLLSGSDQVAADDVSRVVTAANTAILAHEAAHVATQGMGTTVAGLCLGSVGGSPHWFVFNVGDSRVYRYDGEVLAQVTNDHSAVAELVAEGRISEDTARRHPHRHVITRSLGSDPAPDPDIWVRPVVPGERFLVCSDGLPDELTDSEIAGLLGRHAGAQDAAEALVAAAREAGGRDNISVVVVDVPHEASVGWAGAQATVPRAGLAETQDGSTTPRPGVAR